MKNVGDERCMPLQRALFIRKNQIKTLIVLLWLVTILCFLLCLSRISLPTFLIECVCICICIRSSSSICNSMFSTLLFEENLSYPPFFGFFAHSVLCSCYSITRDL